jgi:hypothetical protein
MERPPLTSSAIAGVINDANLDPAQATLDLGYRPLGVVEGFRRCFPIVPKVGDTRVSAIGSRAKKGNMA